MFPTEQDVSVVVCTLNSIASVERCLESIRESDVGEVIVVDGGSTDGTRQIAEAMADLLLTDQGQGLGAARNLGIAQSTKPFILNLGSDNVLPPGQLQIMLTTLTGGDLAGVSARTVIEGSNYPSKGLNAWRSGRFRPGPANVIGTPTLFRGDLLRAHPYDPIRRFSDDSELCERWARLFNARFAISPAVVTEIGKTSWNEIKIRCRMYGISDEEVFREGRKSGWSPKRSLESLLHPLRADLLTPMANLDAKTAAESAPFLMAFTALRYGAWIQRSIRK